MRMPAWAAVLGRGTWHGQVKFDWYDRRIQDGQRRQDAQERSDKEHDKREL